MDDDAFLAWVCDELAQRHGCHTVILYGSQARALSAGGSAAVTAAGTIASATAAPFASATAGGAAAPATTATASGPRDPGTSPGDVSARTSPGLDAAPGTDWDFAGVRAQAGEVRDARVVAGRLLDAFIYGERDLDKLDERSLRLRGGRVLRDERGFGVSLLARIDALYNAGPGRLAEADRQERVLWFRKMLARASRDDLEARYRHAWLLEALLPAYFHLRARWYEGPKRALAWLAEHDPVTHALFARALDERPAGEACAQLVARVTDVV
jgi:hypothetical protein